MKAVKTLARSVFFSLLVGGGVTLGVAQAADYSARTIRLGYALNEAHPQGQGAKKLAEIVAQKSGGKIKVQNFGNSVLGDEVKMMSAVQGGVLDMFIVTTAPLAGAVKEFGVLDVPFLFSNIREADTVLDGPVGDKLLRSLETRGMVGLGWMDIGFRNIVNSKRPVTKLEDISGLKLRTMQSKIFIDSFTSLGANPVPLAFSELFTAMETKAVDGAENAVTVIDSSKWYEVQKYMSVTNHMYAAMAIIINKKLWDGMSADEKKLLRDASVEASRYQRVLNREQELKAVASLKSHGMQVNEMPPTELNRMREKVKPVVADIAKTVGEPLVAELNAELAKLRK
jgi:tripartite ATP-independent transporter DctP family solute receptor